MKQHLERLKGSQHALESVISSIETGNVQSVSTIVRQLTLCIQELLTVLHALAGELEVMESEEEEEPITF
jgi:hypothetical protein